MKTIGRLFISMFIFTLFFSCTTTKKLQERTNALNSIITQSSEKGEELERQVSELKSEQEKSIQESEKWRSMFEQSELKVVALSEQLNTKTVKEEFRADGSVLTRETTETTSERRSAENSEVNVVSEQNRTIDRLLNEKTELNTMLESEIMKNASLSLQISEYEKNIRELKSENKDKKGVIWWVGAISSIVLFVLFVYGLYKFYVFIRKKFCL